jgi:hypothetical protein
MLYDVNTDVRKSGILQKPRQARSNVRIAAAAQSGGALHLAVAIEGAALGVREVGADRDLAAWLEMFGERGDDARRIFEMGGRNLA